MSTPDTNNEAVAAMAEAKMRERLDSLTDEQKQQLSKALFPSTDTRKVTLLGEERELRPLTIKFERQLNVTLQAFQDKVKEGEDPTKVVDIDLLETVLDASKILATFYGWDDVKGKIEEEDVHMEELQALLVIQSQLQESNSFLLMPLRILVVVMQQAEIEMIHLQSTFNGLR